MENPLATSGGRAAWAAVVPRVRRETGGEVLPLEHFVEDALGNGRCRFLNVYGRAGLGKSVAMKHVAAVFGERVQVIDDPTLEDIAAVDSKKFLVFATRERKLDKAVGLELAGWGEDELIEYLLNLHREKCKSVMGRLRGKGAELEGLPELWAGVMEEFAADEGLMEVRDALRRMVKREMNDVETMRDAGRRCREAFSAKGGYEAGAVFPVHLPRRLLRHRVVGVYVAGDQLAEDVEREQWHTLGKMAPREVIEEAARGLKGREAVLGKLRQEMTGRSKVRPAMGASLLVAADAGWRPSARAMELREAILRGARWTGVDISEYDMADADLSQADLSDAKLVRAKAKRANFRQVNLRRAILTGLDAEYANFSMADLTMAEGDMIRLRGAHLNRARLIGVNFPLVVLCEADLQASDFAGAKLRGAKLDWQTQLEDADFSNADLSGAILTSVRLKEARFDGALFRDAILRKCDLEGIEWGQVNFEGADLSGSYLTGSVLRGAHFRAAKLRDTGLAEVNWEGADLQLVDFTGASFHLGSSRSGLVGSSLASEGTRTGFYTDDYEDKNFKAPEEIRKANLRGCDLTGANVEETDFYLVDLRDAIYSDKQGRHFARCGAILNVRV